jgi:Ser/Thr protein kinase RdoA (MazF antagonist)
MMRDADWRFLVPTDTVAAAGAEHGTITRIDDVDDVRRVVGAATPGTWLCVEFAGGSAGAIRRTLGEAGVGDADLYVPWPTSAHPRAWIPVGDEVTAAHVIAGIRGRGFLRGVFRGAQRAIWRARFRRGIGLTARAVFQAGGAGTQRQPDGLRLPRSVAVTIDDSWEEWGLGPRPAAYRTALVTGGSDDVNKVVALVFPAGGRRPSLVVKFARIAPAIAGMQREATVLTRLEQRTGKPVEGVPRLLVELPAHSNALVETYVPGVAMTTQLTEKTFAQLAAAATGWLSDLANGAVLSEASSWWPRIAEPALERLDRVHGRKVDPALVRETADRLQALGALPVVPEHRDFAPWNLLVSEGGKLGVLDWESAEPDGLPFLDLMYFLAYLSFDLENAISSGRPVETYRSLLDERTTVGGVAMECMSRYAAAFALRDADLPALRLLTWLLHATSDARALEPEPASPSADRGALFLALWAEEARRAA